MSLSLIDTKGRSRLPQSPPAETRLTIHYKDGRTVIYEPVQNKIIVLDYFTFAEEHPHPQEDCPLARLYSIPKGDIASYEAEHAF